MLKALPTHNFDIQTVTKCGEIFCYNFTDFTLCCTVCKLETFSFEDFVQHVKHLHFSKESPRSNDEDQEFSDIDSFPKTIWKSKDDEKNTCGNIEQSHNSDNNENNLEYSKDVSDKAMCKFEAEEQGLNYFDGLSGVKCMLKDKEKNICDSIDLSSNDSSDNNYDGYELENAKSLSGKDFCHDNNIIEINCSEDGNSDEDCNNTHQSDKLSDSEYSCRKNEITSSAVDLLKPNLNPIADETPSGTFNKINFDKSLIRHYRCPECYEPFFRKTDMLQHIEERHNSKFICDYENCSRAYQTERQLIAHKCKHKRYNKIICDVCGECCESIIQFKIHLSTHTGEKPHPCEVCGKCFANKANLRQHLTTHSEMRSHKCTLCDKAFNTRNQLKVHMYTHSDERLFKCKFCEKAFKQPSTLGGHVRRVHYKQNK